MRYANSLIIVMQNHNFLVPLQQKIMDPIYTLSISDKEASHSMREAQYNLFKHLKNGSFGENHFKNVVPPLYIRRVSLIIAYSVKNHQYDQEYLKQLLQIVFDKLKAHPSIAIKLDASRAMCDMNWCVKLYLDSDFHPEERAGI